MLVVKKNVYLVLVSINESSLQSKEDLLLSIPTLNIVVGFFEDSFIGVEQGPDHLVQVGYQKGAQIFRQNLEFNIVNTPGTASEPQ